MALNGWSVHRVWLGVLLPITLPTGLSRTDSESISARWIQSSDSLTPTLGSDVWVEVDEMIEHVLVLLLCPYCLFSFFFPLLFLLFLARPAPLSAMLRRNTAL